MTTEHCPICKRLNVPSDDVCEHPKRPTTAPIGGQVTRRSILRIGALFFCAPAIVRAASLMPVHSLAMPVVERRWAGFCERLLYHSLGNDLRAGRTPTVLLNNRRISITEAARMVAYARSQGWVKAWDQRGVTAGHAEERRIDNPN